MKKVTNLVPADDRYRVKTWEVFEVGDTKSWLGDSNHKDCLPGTKMVLNSGLVLLGEVRAASMMGAMSKAQALINEAMEDHREIDPDSIGGFTSVRTEADGGYCVSTVYDGMDNRFTSEFFVLLKGEYNPNDYVREVIEVADDFEI